MLTGQIKLGLVAPIYNILELYNGYYIRLSRGRPGFDSPLESFFWYEPSLL